MPKGGADSANLSIIDILVGGLVVALSALDREGDSAVVGEEDEGGGDDVVALAVDGIGEVLAPAGVVEEDIVIDSGLNG
jgi:hypothetical protein